MARDPLKARTPALLAMAAAIATQLERATEAWPWLEAAGTSADALRGPLTALSATLDDQRALAAALTDASRDPYFRAAPVLERVAQWRAVLRQRLRACDTGGPATKDAARVIRAAVNLDPLRLQGTLDMLLRATGALSAAVGDLPASVKAPEVIAEATALREALQACEAGRRAHLDQQTRALGGAAAAKAALVAHLREVRRTWRLARTLSGGTMPPLNLGAGASDVG